MHTPIYYTLDDDKNVVPVSDVKEWAKLFENEGARRVASTSMKSVWVSTVFLGLDHSFGEGPPLLFETMVFGEDENENETHRYSTWAEAEQGHKDVVNKLEADGEKD